jgi:hypothetical protein
MRLVTQQSSRLAAIIGVTAIVFVLLVSQANAQRPRPRVVVPPNPDKSAPGLPPPPAPKAIPVPEIKVSETDGLALIAALKGQNKAIRLRLGNRLVKGKWRKEAMPFGAAGMNLFASYNHERKIYTRNPDLWAQDLVRHLTGVAIYNDFSQESYGGVLITPRHLLFCAHAHPHAHQTWGPDPNRPGAVHRFLTTGGKVVESKQLHQAQSYGPSLLPGLASADLCVALLDRNLETEGLKVVPVFPPVSDADVSAAEKWARTENQPFAFIGISQGTSRPTHAEPPVPITDYPRKHQRMCYIKNLHDSGKSGHFAPWDYRVWDGDSGTPTFIILKGEPHLWTILTSAPGNGPRVGSYIDHINALISAADENAVLLERLDRPTGLKVRIGKLEP